MQFELDTETIPNSGSKLKLINLIPMSASKHSNKPNSQWLNDRVLLVCPISFYLIFWLWQYSQHWVIECVKRFKIYSVETVSEVSQNSNVKIVTDEKKLILWWLLKLTPFSCTYHLTFSIKLPPIELNCLKFWKKENSKSHKAQKVKKQSSKNFA